jgi:hypothetical protein
LLQRLVALGTVFVALGGPLIELPPEFLDGSPQIGYRVVDSRGHALIPSGRGPSTTRR